MSNVIAIAKATNTTEAPVTPKAKSVKLPVIKKKTPNRRLNKRMMAQNAIAPVLAAKYNFDTDAFKKLENRPEWLERLATKCNFPKSKDDDEKHLKTASNYLHTYLRQVEEAQKAGKKDSPVFGVIKAK